MLKALVIWFCRHRVAGSAGSFLRSANSYVWGGITSRSEMKEPANNTLTAQSFKWKSGSHRDHQSQQKGSLATYRRVNPESRVADLTDAPEGRTSSHRPTISPSSPRPRAMPSSPAISLHPSQTNAQ
ncbi:hypothetical protein VDGL01_03592 [Verticillium dahliae]